MIHPKKMITNQKKNQKIKRINMRINNKIESYKKPCPSKTVIKKRLSKVMMKSQ